LESFSGEGKGSIKRQKKKLLKTKLHSGVLKFGFIAAGKSGKNLLEIANDGGLKGHFPPHFCRCSAMTATRTLLRSSVFHQWLVADEQAQGSH